jgi:hypothetical protein
MLSINQEKYREWTSKLNFIYDEISYFIIKLDHMAFHLADDQLKGHLVSLKSQLLKHAQRLKYLKTHINPSNIQFDKAEEHHGSENQIFRELYEMVDHYKHCKHQFQGLVTAIAHTAA